MHEVENEFSGTNTGNVVQAGSISGGVHFHQTAPSAGVANRQRLATALRALTRPVTVEGEPRTAVALAPGRLATYGNAVQFLESDGRSHVCVHRAVEPGDELWGFGYPSGEELGVVWLRCMAVLDDRSGPHPLTLLRGEPGIGSTGGPVLNWRTGAVCGLMLVSASGVWLVPVDQPEADDRRWLELLDDDQLRASGRRFPGPRLRTYLAEVRRIGDGHPYRPMVQQGPSLTEFYLPQHLHHESDGTHRISVDVLADRHDGAQVIGDPGVGKSSLVRYLAAESAGGWLTGGTGSFVPIPVAARVLAGSGALPRLLADGVTQELTTMLDTVELTELFSREPMPGVPWLVLVDGLDEVLSDLDRRLVLDRVLGQTTYRVLVTSRPLGSYAFSRLAKKFPTYVVEPFNDEELARFARAWFDDAGHRDPDVLVEQFMAQVERTGLDRLARVPLVAMMLCIVFGADHSAGLPQSLYAVYEQFFAVLARKLDTAREQFRTRVAAFGAEAEAAMARLVSGLPALLSQVAVARQGVRRGEFPDTRPLLAQAVARSLPDKPAVIPADTWTELVAEALRASGLLVHRRDDFRFLHQTVEEYLAARNLAESASRAERRTMLAPQREWPWPHLEIKIFVVALLARQNVDLAPQLSRLLSRRHRQANAGFVVELIRRGVPVPDRVRVLVCDVLTERIHSTKTMSRDWLESVRWLRDIHPARSLSELERFARDQSTQDRAVEAVRELSTLDRERAVTLARQLIDEWKASPANRFKLAELLFTVDRQLGLNQFVTLISHEDMRQLSLDTAIQAAARTILTQDPATAIRLLDEIWRQRIPPNLRLVITQQIAKVDATAAAWRFFELVQDSRQPPDLRFTAARELFTVDSTRCAQAMTQLADADDLPPDTRLAAAVYLTEELGQNTASLSALAAERVPTTVRLQAVSHLAHHDQSSVARLLLQIAEDSQPAERSEILGSTAGFEPELRLPTLLHIVEAGDTPTEVALDCARYLRDVGRTDEIEVVLDRIIWRGTDEHRMAAAGILASVDQARAQRVYSSIARDDSVDDHTRLKAADLVREFSATPALQLYAKLCRGGVEASVRIEAGSRAGEINSSEGIHALATFARGYDGTLHLEEIAKAMVDIDKAKAIEIWRVWVRKGSLVIETAAIEDR